MYKTVSVFIFAAFCISLILSACDINTDNEYESESNNEIIEVIDKSKPITDGNLITKTNTEKDGSINVEYFDNSDNLVEQYVWKDDAPVSHYVMTYTDDNLVMTKEEISPDGSDNVVYSYQYDSDNSIFQTTKSIYKDGMLTKSEIYDSNNTVTESTHYTYNENKKLSQVRRFDNNDILLEYFSYEYTDNGLMKKYSSHTADGDIKMYTTFEYNSEALLICEKYFNEKNELQYSMSYDYYESGTKKSSTKYDSQGNILSQTNFDEE